MIKWASGLYAGHVTHRRFKPKKHNLSYRMFWLLLDLDEIDAVASATRFFSRNRFNLFSFFDRDHLDGSATSLRDQVEHYLRAAGFKPDGGAIRMAAMPRILGYAFNPLSVYFCYSRDDSLIAMLYEVNNTFGERHSYLIPVDKHAGDSIVQRCAKEFYVSPFMDMALTYDFRVTEPTASLLVTVNASDREGPVLATGFSGKHRAITDKMLLHAFFSHPLLSLKVVGGIHWEALRIWLKGVKFHSRPQAPVYAVTIIPIDEIEDLS